MPMNWEPWTGCYKSKAAVVKIAIFMDRTQNATGRIPFKRQIDLTGL